ncbi:hypothetical protein AAHS21_04560 [Mycobacterium sp. 050272]
MAVINAERQSVRRGERAAAVGIEPAGLSVASIVVLRSGFIAIWLAAMA